MNTACLALATLIAAIPATSRASETASEAPVTRALAVPTHELKRQKQQQMDANSAARQIPLTLHGSFAHTHPDGTIEVVCRQLHNKRAIQAQQEHAE